MPEVIKVRDDKTGKVFEISYDGAPPTQSELSEIFEQKAGQSDIQSGLTSAYASSKPSPASTARQKPLPGVRFRPPAASRTPSAGDVREIERRDAEALKRNNAMKPASTPESIRAQDRNAPRFSKKPIGKDFRDMLASEADSLFMIPAAAMQRATGDTKGAVKTVKQGMKAGGKSLTGRMASGVIGGTPEGDEGGAFRRGFEQGIAPGAGGLAGFATGSRIGAQVPGNPIIKGISGLVGGLAGATAGSGAVAKAQDAGLNFLLGGEGMQELQKQRALDFTNNPVASSLGQAATAAVFGKATADDVRALPEVIRAIRTTGNLRAALATPAGRVLSDTLKERMMEAGVEVVAAAGENLITGKPMNWADTGIQALSGALLPGENRFGTPLTSAGRGAVDIAGGLLSSRRAFPSLDFSGGMADMQAPSAYAPQAPGAPLPLPARPAPMVPLAQPASVGTQPANVLPTNRVQVTPNFTAPATSPFSMLEQTPAQPQAPTSPLLDALAARKAQARQTVTPPRPAAPAASYDSLAAMETPPAIDPAATVPQYTEAGPGRARVESAVPVVAEAPKAQEVEQKEPWQMSLEEFESQPDFYSRYSTPEASESNIRNGGTWFTEGKNERYKTDKPDDYGGMVSHGRRFSIKSPFIVDEKTLDTNGGGYPAWYVEDFVRDNYPDEYARIISQYPRVSPARFAATESVFSDHLRSNGYDAAIFRGVQGKKGHDEAFVLDAQNSQTHNVIVEKALAEGKPVPPEVLKDYPDLAAKYSPAKQKAPESLISPAAVNDAVNKPLPAESKPLPKTTAAVQKKADGMQAAIQSANKPNSVVVLLRGANGEVRGVSSLEYDGTAEGARAAHDQIMQSQGMAGDSYYDPDEVSNIQSIRAATGADGSIKYIISPNGKTHEWGSDGALYALGDLSAGKRIAAQAKRGIAPAPAPESKPLPSATPGKGMAARMVEEAPAPRRPFVATPAPEAVRFAIDVPSKNVKTAAMNPSLSAGAFKGADALYYWQGDIGQILFNAKVTVGGQSPNPATVKEASLYEAAQKAGYRRTNYRAGNKGTVWVMEKDGKILTRRGAEALLGGQVIGKVEDAGRGRESAQPILNQLGRFLDSLPDSTRENLGALAAAFNRTPLASQVRINRSESGRLRVDASGLGWFVYEPETGTTPDGRFSDLLDSSLPRFIEKLRYMASTPMGEGKNAWLDHDRAADKYALERVPAGSEARYLGGKPQATTQAPQAPAPVKQTPESLTRPAEPVQKTADSTQVAPVEEPVDTTPQNYERLISEFKRIGNSKAGRKIIRDEAGGKDVAKALIALAETQGIGPIRGVTEAYDYPDGYELKTENRKIPTIKPASPEKAARSHVHTDPTRNILLGILYDAKNQNIVATDTHRAFVYPTKVEGETRVIGSDGREIEGTFPNYSRIVPRELTGWGDIDATSVLKSAHAAMDINKERENSTGSVAVIRYDSAIGPQDFNPKYIADAITALVQTGAKRIQVAERDASVSRSVTIMVMRGDNGAYVVLMPLGEHDSSRVYAQMPVTPAEPMAEWNPFGDSPQPKQPAKKARATTKPTAPVEESGKAQPADGGKDTAPDEVAKDAPLTLEEHEKFFADVRDNGTTPEILRREYERMVANKEAIVAELNKKTVAQLHQIVYPRPGDKKADTVNRIYNALLGRFTLDSTVSWQPFSETYEQASRKVLDKITQADIDAYVEKRKEAKQKREEQKAATVAAIENPQTYEDYRTLLRVKGIDSLTPEQKRTYEDLLAEKTKSERKPTPAARPAAPAPSGQSYSVVEHFHSKRGANVYIAVPAARMEATEYQSELSRAKALGGYYSRAWQDSPGGFAFKSAADASTFVEGAPAAEEMPAAQEGESATPRNPVVERMRATAERMEEAANESLNRDRKTNTHRQAAQAASAEADANRSLRIAKTMRAIADAIENGTAKYLDGVKSRAVIEDLDYLLKASKWAAVKANGERTDTFDDRDVKIEDIDHTEYPYPGLRRSELKAAITELSKKRVGAARLATLQANAVGGEPVHPKKIGNLPVTSVDTYTFTYEDRDKIGFDKKIPDAIYIYAVKAGGNIQGAEPGQVVYTAQKEPFMGQLRMYTTPQSAALSAVSSMVGGAAAKDASPFYTPYDGDKWVTIKSVPDIELLRSVDRLSEFYVERFKRLQAADIKTPAELKAALREYIGLVAPAPASDPIKKAERELIGRKIPGYFPTPPALVEKMLGYADIQPGMSVLEPSAGKGNIADAIKEAHPDAEISAIEPVDTLRTILEAKGHELVGRDFLEHQGEYDRIVMNPPFENGQDMAHVRHAYGLLKPGGVLVAITSEGPFYRSDKKAQEFREWLEQTGGTSEKNPDKSFMDSERSTGVATRMVTIEKPETATSADTRRADLEAKKAAATAKIKKAAGVASTRLYSNPLPPPEMIEGAAEWLAAEIGLRHLQAQEAIKDTAAATRVLMDEFGDWIRPHAEKIVEQAREKFQGIAEAIKAEQGSAPAFIGEVAETAEEEPATKADTPWREDALQWVSNRLNNPRLSEAQAAATIAIDNAIRRGDIVSWERGSDGRTVSGYVVQYEKHRGVINSNDEYLRVATWADVDANGKPTDGKVLTLPLTADDYPEMKQKYKSLGSDTGSFIKIAQEEPPKEKIAPEQENSQKTLPPDFSAGDNEGSTPASVEPPKPAPVVNEDDPRRKLLKIAVQQEIAQELGVEDFTEREGLRRKWDDTIAAAQGDFDNLARSVREVAASANPGRLTDEERIVAAMLQREARDKVRDLVSLESRTPEQESQLIAATAEAVAMGRALVQTASEAGRALGLGRLLVDDSPGGFMKAVEQAVSASDGKLSQRAQAELFALAARAEQVREAVVTQAEQRATATQQEAQEAAREAVKRYKRSTPAKKATDPNYGKDNTVFTREKYEAAKAALERAKNPTRRGATLPSPLPSAVEMQAYRDIGGFHFEAGLRRFGEWANQVRSDVGQDIEDSTLGRVWNDVVTKQRRFMTDAEYDAAKKSRIDALAQTGKPVSGTPRTKNPLIEQATAEYAKNAKSFEAFTRGLEKRLGIGTDGEKLPEALVRDLFKEAAREFSKDSKQVEAIKRKLAAQIESEILKSKPALYRRIVGLQQAKAKLIAFRATYDTSFFGRQGGKIVAARPGTGAKAFAEGMRVFFSPDLAAAVDAEIAADMEGYAFKPDFTGYAQEENTEGLASGPVSKWLDATWTWLKEHGIDRSEEANRTILNRLRLDYFKSLAKPTDPPEYQKAMADLVNIMSSRGDMKYGEKDISQIVRVAHDWAQVWSPRNNIANLQFLAAQPIVKPALAGALAPTPEARAANRRAAMVATREYARYAGTVGLFLAMLGGIARAFGWEDWLQVDMNPRSKDFGKVRVGQLELDFTSGWRKHWAFVNEMLGLRQESEFDRRERVKSEAGATRELLAKGQTTPQEVAERQKAQNFKERNRGNILEAYGRSMLNPLAGEATTQYLGRDFKGEPVKVYGLQASSGQERPKPFFNAKEAAIRWASQVGPLSLTQWTDAIREAGGTLPPETAAAMAVGMPFEFIGVGAGARDRRPEAISKQREQAAEKKQGFTPASSALSKMLGIK